MSEDSAIAEAQRGGPLGVDDGGLGQGIQVIVTDQAVVAKIFDAQEASVGGKADLPQGGQIAERTTNLEVIGVVDGGFGAKGLPFFVVLLDLGFLVLDVEGRHDALGENARAEAPRCASRDTPLEDQLHLIRTAEVEILSHDFFEEAAPGDWPIEDLREGELRLEDRELVPIARLPMGGREGMRQAAEPLAKDRIDLVGCEGIGDLLDAARRVGRSNAVVQRLERNPTLRQLALEPLVPIETDLGGIGKIRTELDEERPEVAVEQVEVVMIGQRGGPADPRVGLPLGIPALLGPEDTGLLLGLADKEHAFVAFELGEVLLRDVILPLPLFERHQIDALRLRETLDRLDEALAHRRNHHRRWHPHAELRFEEVGERSSTCRPVCERASSNVRIASSHRTSARSSDSTFR
jgi:hypothetical protein